MYVSPRARKIITTTENSLALFKKSLNDEDDEELKDLYIRELIQALDPIVVTDEIARHCIYEDNENGEDWKPEFGDLDIEEYKRIHGLESEDFDVTGLDNSISYLWENRKDREIEAITELIKGMGYEVSYWPYSRNPELQAQINSFNQAERLNEKNVKKTVETISVTGFEALFDTSKAYFFEFKKALTEAKFIEKTKDAVFRSAYDCTKVFDPSDKINWIEGGEYLQYFIDLLEKEGVVKIGYNKQWILGSTIFQVKNENITNGQIKSYSKKRTTKRTKQLERIVKLISTHLN